MSSKGFTSLEWPIGSNSRQYLPSASKAIQYTIAIAVMAQTGSCRLSTTQTDLEDGNGVFVEKEDTGGSRDQLPSDSLVVVTSHEFQCCGNITGWQTYVSPAGSLERVNRVYSILFQVWRSVSGGVAGDGCYTVTGDDRYDDIELSPETGGLVNRTLEPADYLTVQPGDVVGYFMSHSAGDNREAGILLERRDTQEVAAWYTTNTNDNPIRTGPPDCPYTVGPGKLLSSSTTSAPILNVQIGKSHKI